MGKVGNFLRVTSNTEDFRVAISGVLLFDLCFVS